ncbi:hypothetical protein PBY51_007167 [Eleginops maclovinus]|uniref:Uncharacterized protein n=1 Tax=Eleginops maclovinus TaxID=56733 RepID=A0AAN8AFS4_ELEMC|nr:hypothetical protein PBY51_007167 [Eleginops maclovinus]
MCDLAWLLAVTQLRSWTTLEDTRTGGVVSQSSDLRPLAVAPRSSPCRLSSLRPPLALTPCTLQSRQRSKRCWCCSGAEPLKQSGK